MRVKNRGWIFNVIIVLIFALEASAILMTADSNFRISYLFLIVFVILYYLRRFLSKSQKNVQGKSSAFEYIFIVLILITMLFRGSGLQILGSTLWGGSTYIVLVSAVFFSMSAKKTSVDSELIKRIIVWMTIFSAIPFMVDIFIRYHMISKSILPYFDFDFDPNRIRTGKNLGEYLVLVGLVIYPPIKDNMKMDKRFILFLIPALILIGLSGYRIGLAFVCLILSIYMFTEKKYNKIKILVLGPYVVLPLVFFLLVAIPYLPNSFQRSLSFLAPGEINNKIENEANMSLRFRFDIWSIALDEASKYAVIGRGFAFNNHEAYDLANSNSNLTNLFEFTNNFHNGPIAIYMTLGAGGLILFLIIFLKYIKKYYKYCNLTWQNTSSHRVFRVIYVYYITLILQYILLYGDVIKSLPELFIVLGLLHICVNNFILPKNDNNSSDKFIPKMIRSEQPI
jgi:O-Antigen ligase